MLLVALTGSKGGCVMPMMICTGEKPMTYQQLQDISASLALKASIHVSKTFALMLYT